MNAEYSEAGRDGQTGTSSQPPAGSTQDAPNVHRGPRPPLKGHPDAAHGIHRWMMIACCIPMVVIVGVLIATGAAGSGLLLYAAICIGAMVLMMFAMPGGHKH